MTPLPDPRTLFTGLQTDRPIIIAVSGGSDSIAMLLMANLWAQSAGADLQVVTVDHGLRPEAAAEAAFVAGVAESLNLMHVTLAWDGIKPESGISHAARNARYRLLEEFAADIGAQVILVGHTANDQAETIIMRNKRGDIQGQGRGLSGIAREMILPNGTRLVRPLLSLTRKDLRNYLSEMNQSWVEDPSNLDASYERVRVRNELADNQQRIQEICKFGSLMGRYRQHLADEAATILVEHLKISHGPVYSISDAVLENTAPDIRMLVVQVMVAISGGAEHFVSENALLRLFDAEMNDRMTAGNSVIEKRKTGFRFYREKRNLPAIIIGPGDKAVWDGRLLVENNSAMSYFCSAPSFEQLQEIEQSIGKKLDVRPRAALASTPFLCGDGDDITLPLVNGFEIPTRLNISIAVRAIEHFCPEYDFSLLEFVQSLKSRLGNLKSRQI